jgi:hypothetical protein
LTHPTSKDITACLETLEALIEDPACVLQVDLAVRNRLLTAAGRVSRPERDEQRLVARAVKKLRKEKRREEDEAKLVRTGIRQKRLDPVFITPEPLALAEAKGRQWSGGPGSLGTGSVESGQEEASPPLHKSRGCYICKVHCTEVHFFYDRLCNACGDFNYQKRSQTADLRGRVALITGARVKIGYQAAILLLRAGAHVIVSTRFPRDAALRYAGESDYDAWKDRLQIYGLDLRHTPSVEAFARHLRETLSRLDFVIHNACQTVRRPVGFYSHLMAGEGAALSELPAPAQSLLSSYEAMRAATLRQLGTGASTALPAERRRFLRWRSRRKIWRPGNNSFRSASWTPICNRWTCGK